MFNIKGFLTVLTVSALSFSTQAATLNSSNGHYYELVEFADIGRLDWNQAKTYAQNSTFMGASGYLATLTSVAEDDFVWDLGAQDYFLGAYDNSTNDGAGNWTHNAWQWVTGETFSYDNWLPGEPNHWQDGSDQTANNEDYLMYWGKTRGWNDTNVDSSYLDGVIQFTTRGFVIEYEPAPTHAPVPGAFWLFGSILAVVGWHKKKELFANS